MFNMLEGVLASRPKLIRLHDRLSLRRFPENQKRKQTQINEGVKSEIAGI